MPLVDGGFPADPNPAAIGIKPFKVPGSAVTLNVRADVAPLLIGFAAWFHANVEPLHVGHCGGYNYRPKATGSGALSNHAAGIAIDLNYGPTSPPWHPYKLRGTFRAEIVPEIRRRAAFYGLRWGGDYHGSPVDEMHFEVHLPIAAAQSLARKVPGGRTLAAASAPAPTPDAAVLDLTLTGKANAQSAQLAEAITGSELTRTLDGAANLKLTVADPKRVLLRGVAGHPSRIVIDGLVYELAGVTKHGDSLDLTFEDELVSALRAQTGFRTVVAGTMSRAQFAEILVNEARRGAFVGQMIETLDSTRTVALSAEALSRGTQEDPDTETTWDAIGRFAADIGWRRFSDGRHVYFGSDDWLLSRANPIEISEDTSGVDTIDFKFFVGFPVAECTLTCNFSRQGFPIGYPVQLTGQGPADGRDWLVKDTKRPLHSPQGTVTLQHRIPEKRTTPGGVEPVWPGGAPPEDEPGHIDEGRRPPGPMSGAAVATALVFGSVVDGDINSVGWGDDLWRAIAIAYAESGWRADARNINPAHVDKHGKHIPQTVDIGLMQVNTYWNPKYNATLLEGPLYCAHAAFEIYTQNGRSFANRWATFDNGAYRAHEVRARQAIVDAGKPD